MGEFYGGESGEYHAEQVELARQIADVENAHDEIVDELKDTIVDMRDDLQEAHGALAGLLAGIKFQVGSENQWQACREIRDRIEKYVVPNESKEAR